MSKFLGYKPNTRTIRDLSMGISRQVVTFEVKSQMYGADIFLLDEILPMMEFREIPKGPSFLEGLINLRGQMIPLVDLRKNFGATKISYSLSTRILVVRCKERRIGFIVDDVHEVKTFEKPAVRPAVTSAGKEGMMAGIAELENGQIVQLLNMDRVIDEASLEQLCKAEAEGT